MICDAARPFFNTALQERLSRLRVSPGLHATAASIDPEKILQKVMVSCLPKVSRLGHLSEWRQEVGGLLLGLCASAASDDLRYLDAFNNFFEAVEWLPEWRADASWREVEANYALLLRSHLERTPPAAKTGPTVLADMSSPAASPPPATVLRRVLILADNARAAARIYEPVSSLAGMDVHILVCNNSNRRLPGFYARQLAILALAAISRAPQLVKAVWRRQVHLRGTALHSAPVTQWLSAGRFWLGLHAMGVIYRAAALSAFERGVLNAHIGLLPAYRGRSVMEWSLLAGAPTGITVFVMDAGIDTGKEIVLREEIAVTGQTSILRAKRFLFEQDGRLFRQAIARLLAPDFIPAANDESGHRYYMMSSLLVGVAEEVLRGQGHSDPIDQRAEAAGRVGIRRA